MFTLSQYEEFRKKNDPTGKKYFYDYKKGLGSMLESEWHELFKQYPLEKLLQPMHLKDSEAPEEELEELHKWLADDSEFRKSKILNKIFDFDINKI